jgi:circadian clock protein KaiC
MRGLPNLLGLHSMRIDRQGITVFPRAESVYAPIDIGLSSERIPLGLAELDTMISGGLPVGSVTLLAGALGTGKTLACVHFVMEGARRGEKSLFVGFRETPRQLFDKARAFGLDLEGAVRSGQVEILHRSPVDLNVDEAIWELLGNVERVRPRRLALDGMAELEQGILEERRQRGIMASLAGLLRERGATSLLTKEIAQVVGPELDFSDTPLAALAENLLLLRYVEFRGEIYRILSILKMRDSPHDHSIRQYTITGQGLRVLARMETAEGVLTGIGRLPSETRVKRKGGREGELAT